MAKSYANLVSSTDTFASWLERTNQITDDLKNIIITTAASATPNTTNGGETSGNSFVNGVFTANTISVIQGLRGGNTSTPANLPISSNAVFSATTDANSTTAAVLLSGGLLVARKIFANGAITAANTFAVTGNATFSNTLAVTGNATFSNTLAVTGNAAFSNSATFSGSSVTVSGNSFFTNTSGANSSMAPVNISGGLLVGNNSHFSKAVFVSDLTDANSTAASVATDGGLLVGKQTYATGAATFANTLSVTGVATLSSTVGVTGAATFANTVGVTGAATFSKTIAVTGAATFANTLGVTGNSSVTKDFTVSGNTHLSGNTVFVTNNSLIINAATTEISGTVNFSGNTTFASNVSLSAEISTVDTMTVNETLNMTSANLVFDATSYITGNTRPSSNNTQDLGSSLLRWRDAYVRDISALRNVTISGNTTISANLTVNTLLGANLSSYHTNVFLEDRIPVLGGVAAPSVDDNKDRGFVFRWHNGVSAKKGFFGYDDSTGKFTFIQDATDTAKVISGTKGTIDAELEWSDVLSKPSPVITLGGDLTGNATFTELGNTTLTVSVVPGNIDHDLLGNFVANEHIDHTSVSISAGNGLSGGGTIAANRTLSVTAGNGLVANATGVHVLANTGIIANTTGVFANSSYITGLVTSTVTKTYVDALNVDADTIDGLDSLYLLDFNNATNVPDPTITLDGDVTGSTTLTNLANGTITVIVADDSHNHIITNIDGLQANLDAKAPLASPGFTGSPTAPLQANTTDNATLATTSFVQNIKQNIESGLNLQEITTNGAVTNNNITVADLTATGNVSAAFFSGNASSLSLTQSQVVTALEPSGLFPTARLLVSNPFGGGGPAVIQDQVGITSVNRTSQGVVDVVLADTMASNISYTVVTCVDDGAGFAEVRSRTTTGFTIQTRSTGTGNPLTDFGFNLIVMGTKA